MWFQRQLFSIFQVIRKVTKLNRIQEHYSILSFLISCHSFELFSFFVDFSIDFTDLLLNSIYAVLNWHIHWYNFWVSLVDES